MNIVYDCNLLKQCNIGFPLRILICEKFTLNDVENDKHRSVTKITMHFIVDVLCYENTESIQNENNSR